MNQYRKSQEPSPSLRSDRDDQTEITKADQFNQQQELYPVYQQLKASAERHSQTPDDQEGLKLPKKLLRTLGKKAVLTALIVGTSAGLANLIDQNVDFSKDPSFNPNLDPETGKEYSFIYQPESDPSIMDRFAEEAERVAKLRAESEELRQAKQLLEANETNIEADENWLPKWKDHMSDTPPIYPDSQPDIDQQGTDFHPDASPLILPDDEVENEIIETYQIPVLPDNDSSRGSKRLPTKKSLSVPYTKAGETTTNNHERAGILKTIDKLPVEGRFKSFMDYDMITDPTSPQYQFKQNPNLQVNEYSMVCYRDPKTKAEYPLVAVGSGVTSDIGRIIEVEFTHDDQKTDHYRFCVGEHKADKDTDTATHTYHTSDKSVVEFMVKWSDFTKNRRSAEALKNGDMAFIDGKYNFHGKITKITVLDQLAK